jgi:nucleotide-binding universal stress UspA family protein
MSIDQPVTVVGYDGSPSSDRAIEYAIDRLGPGSLRIVHAWEPPPMLRGAEVYPVLAAASLARAEALVDDLPRRHPRLEQVAWIAQVVEGRPAHALLAAAREFAATMIVVGTRRHGRVRSALGSTAHAVLHESPCPVTVVPAHLGDHAAA